MSFDQLEQICGEVGLRIDEFYKLTPRQFQNYLQGVYKKQEADLKLKMTLNRDLEFAMISPYLDKKHKNLTPQKYKPFPWESEQDSAGLKSYKTKEELQAIWDKIDRDKNGE